MKLILLLVLALPTLGQTINFPNGTQIVISGTSPARDIRITSPELTCDFDHSHFYYVYTNGYMTQTKQYYMVQQCYPPNFSIYSTQTVVEPTTGLTQSFNGSISSGGTYIFWYIEPNVMPSGPTVLQVFTFRNGQYAFQPPISF